MRNKPRAILPAVVAAVFLLLSMQQATATEHFATPVIEPEPVAPRSIQMQPIAGGEPVVEFSHSSEIRRLPNADYHFTAAWDFTNVSFKDDYGIEDPGDVTFSFTMTLAETQQARQAILTYDDAGAEGQYGFTSSIIFNGHLAAECKENSGRLQGTMNFLARNNQTNEIFYRAESQSFDIDCTVLVKPEPPGTRIRVCGSDNDVINIPDQPDGVTVDTGAWSNGERVVTYSPANWATFPDDFVTTYTFNDEDDCEASFTGPESLYLLDENSQVAITGKYDLSSVWPDDRDLTAGMTVIITSDRIYRSTGLNPVLNGQKGEFSASKDTLNEWVLELCADPDFAGELKIHSTLRFSYPSGNSSISVLEYVETLVVPCTVAVTPLPASVDNDVCGYVNERIIVPTQKGIAGHTINWNDNVATITYQPATAYQIVDGTYTVTVTADPCVIEGLTAPVHNAVCGENNDTVDVPSNIDNVTIDVSGSMATDGYVKISFTPDPGYVLPESIESEYEFVDTGNCTVEGLTPPIHNAVCGENNDTVDVPSNIDHVTINVTGSMATDGSVKITFTPDPGYVLPENIQSEYEFTDTGNCTVEGLTAPIHNAVCGENNDTVDMPSNVDHVTIDVTGSMAEDGFVKITFIPADGYVLPENIQSEYEFIDTGNCVVTPIDPQAPVAVCGPNNDEIVIPTQPKGVIVDDSGWVENERTIEFLADEHYVLAENIVRLHTFKDENISCEGDPVTTTLIVTFETSDGESLEGQAFKFYAPVASQVAQEPFVEGEIGPGNQVVIADLIAGTYRVVVNAEGYEAIDELIEVAADSASEEHVIMATALQPVETPTPSPTPSPTSEATPSPTAEPTATEEPAPVSGLPSTGSGQGNGFGILAAAGLLAAMILGMIGVRNRPVSRR